MELTIKINTDAISAAELKESLEQRPDWKDLNIGLSLRKSKVRTRGLDPAILVAIVGAASTSMGALIAGLFQIAKEKSAERIVIQGADGERVEFPANLPPEEIDDLIEKARKLGAPKIIVE